MSSRQPIRRSKEAGGTLPALHSGGRVAAHGLEAEWQELVGRLQAVIERMRSVCVILDAESRIAAWNAAARLAFGWSAEEVLGREPGDVLVRSEAWEDFKAIYRQAGQAGLSTSAVLEQEMEGGGVRACEWQVAALRRPDGVVVGYTAMVDCRDPVGAGPRREAVGESSWEAVFDQTPVPTFLLSVEGRIIRTNDAARRLVQGAGQALEGRSLGEALACPVASTGGERCGKDPHCLVCGLGEALKSAVREGGTITRREVRQNMPCREGLYEARLMVSASPVRREGRSMILLSLEEVTNRRSSEVSVREQAMLLAAAEDAICIMDLEGRIVFWSAGAERLYGWPVSEAMEQTVSEVLFGGASYPWAGLRGMVLEKGSWEGDLEPFSRRKEALSVRARAWAMQGATAEETSIVLVATDLTGKRHLEQQLLRAQRMESVGTMTCGIAHDLSNVLTPVQMAAELLRPTVAGTEGERFLNLLVRSAVRGVEITRQLLLFGRGHESGRTPVDLRSLTKETVKMLSATFPRSIRVRSEIPEVLWPVSGHATQLHQVLVNLCVNARDAMVEGGVLTLRLSQHELDETSAKRFEGGAPGRFVVLSVRDTGTGITPDVRERMFDPFFTTKPPGMGTGLGLSTVLGIVREHRGFLSVTTEPGRGTEFSVYLPVSEVTAEGPSAPAGAAVAGGHGEAVLVVEEDETIRELSKSLLERAGYRVVTASDGAEAVSVFARGHGGIGVVVLDMTLPLIDGASVIRMIRKLEPEVGIVALSGLPTMNTVAGEAAGQRFAFLTKPLHGGELLSAVAGQLARNPRDVSA